MSPLVRMSGCPDVADLLHLQSLPESLRYLLTAGQNEKAANVLKRMAASNGKELPCGQLTAAAEVLSSSIFINAVKLTEYLWPDK